MMAQGNDCSKCLRTVPYSPYHFCFNRLMLISQVGEASYSTYYCSFVALSEIELVKICIVVIMSAFVWRKKLIATLFRLLGFYLFRKKKNKTLWSHMLINHYFTELITLCVSCCTQVFPFLLQFVKGLPLWSWWAQFLWGGKFSSCILNCLGSTISVLSHP